MKYDCADESRYQNVWVVLQGRIVLERVISTARLFVAIASVKHEVSGDPRQRQLHHEYKQAVHEIAR